MLTIWKETYFKVRAKIEASGRDARWEFDRRRLFEKTDHMATICQDLETMAQVRYFFCYQDVCKLLNEYEYF